MTCQREGCNKPIPPNRTKYCCERCSKIANSRRANERSRRKRLQWSAPGSDKRAPRVCLSCDELFMSEGPWNRICGKCKDAQSVKQRMRSAHLAARVERDDDPDLRDLLEDEE